MSKYQIEWSNEALSSAKSISDYIYQRWGIKATIDFSDKIKKLMVLLSSNKELCPKSKKKKIRRCVVTEQTSVVYKESKGIIQLITFIDNRSDHMY